MSDQPSGSPPPHRRRPSLVDFFQPRTSQNNTSAISSSPPSNNSPPSPGEHQHRRGMSIASMGLSGTAAGQTSPYNAFARQRRASFAASSASSSPEFRNSFGDDPAVIEEDEPMRSPYTPQAATFARRVSFGAQALRESKQGNSPGSPGAGEGFNWSEALRDRTKRSPSFSSGNPFAANANRQRPSNPAPIPEPPKEMPKPAEPVPMKMRKPDHLGERMLRGEFMMD